MTIDPRWTPADLAARWRCSVATVMARVRERGIPFLWLGRGEPHLTGRGRQLVRFNPRAIEAWEAEQERRWEPAEEGGERGKVRVVVKGLARGQRAWVPD